MLKFRKDPDALLDYQFDWSRWLQDHETIIAFEIFAPGLTLDDSVNDGQVVAAWLAGGTNGTVYTVTCRISTNEGRTDDRSIKVWVEDR